MMLQAAYSYREYGINKMLCFADHYHNGETNYIL